MNAEGLGWVSSLVLVLTMGRQVYKQWKSGESQGVSKWLFIGQVSPEVGFVVYSWIVGNWVFVFTNAALLVENSVGLWITLRHRRLVAGSAGASRAA
jgi:MtN3 and saliva related transmembrane protein